MGLEHELVELNGAYQNTVATNLDLRERIQQLEQLVKDYQRFVGELDIRYGYGAIRVAERNELQQRAKELLSSE